MVRMLLIGKRFEIEGFFFEHVAGNLHCFPSVEDMAFCHVHLESPCVHVGTSVLSMCSLIPQLEDKKYNFVRRTSRAILPKYNGTFQMLLPLRCCTVEVYRTQMGQTDTRTSISCQK